MSYPTPRSDSAKAKPMSAAKRKQVSQSMRTLVGVFVVAAISAALAPKSKAEPVPSAAVQHVVQSTAQ